MIKGYENKKLKLNAPLRGFPAGSVIPIRMTGGVPADPYWRDRFRDARTDRCVEIVKENKSRKSQKKKEVE